MKLRGQGVSARCLWSVGLFLSQQVGDGIDAILAAAHRGCDGELEGGSFAGRAVNGESASHSFGELSGDSQAQAGADGMSGVGGFRLDEGFEDMIELVFADADAGVGDFKAELGGYAREVESVYGQAYGTFVGELDGIAEEVDEDLFESQWIGDDPSRDAASASGIESKLFLLRLGLHEGADFVDQLTDITACGAQLHLAGFEFGQVEGVVDQ